MPAIQPLMTAVAPAGITTELRKERQGINGAVTVAGQELKGWQVFPLPMNDFAKLQFHESLKSAPTGPAFYRGQFDLHDTGDTFLDTRSWGKGAAVSGISVRSRRSTSPLPG